MMTVIRRHKAVPMRKNMTRPKKGKLSFA